MKKTVYTHLGLQKGLAVYLLLFCCLYFMLVVYVFPLIYGKSYTNIGFTATVLGILYSGWLLTQALQVVEISDEGIKSYNLLQREVFLTWGEIKSYGLCKWAGFEREKTYEPEKSVLTSLKGDLYIYLSKTGKPDFRVTTMRRKTGSIRFPYRRDVYKTIANKLEYIAASTNPISQY